MSRNKIKRVVIVLAVTVFIIVLAQILKSFQVEPAVEQPVRPVKTMTLEQNEGSYTRSYPGVVKAAQAIDLSFQVSGRIIEMPVTEGQQVQQGDLIARLDPTDYVNRRDAAKAQYDTALSNLERSKSLYERDMISQVELETRQATFDVNTAEYNIAQKAVDDTYIYAPFPGLISSRLVELYEQVQTQQTVMTLEDLRNIDITINIPETTVRHFNKYVINAFCLFGNDDSTQYPLTVKEFSTNPDPQTKTYRATLTMERIEGLGIIPGMAVRVLLNGRLKDGNTEDVFIIPLSALFSTPDGESQVWVIDESDMTVHSRAVETGTLSDDYINIIDGIANGESIVTAGVSQLMEGQTVRYYNQ